MWLGPYEILKHHSDVAYKLKLPLTVMSLLVETRAEESSVGEVEKALSLLACIKADSALATGE
jgi:hypothetical protein